MWTSAEAGGTAVWFLFSDLWRSSSDVLNILTWTHWCCVKQQKMDTVTLDHRSIWSESCFQSSLPSAAKPFFPLPAALCIQMRPELLPDFHLSLDMEYVCFSSKYCSTFGFYWINCPRTDWIYWLTSHCTTASLCWAFGTRTAGPAGILLWWSHRPYPGSDPGTRTVPCLSPWQSTAAPASSGENSKK